MNAAQKKLSNCLNQDDTDSLSLWIGTFHAMAEMPQCRPTHADWDEMIGVDNELAPHLRKARDAFRNKCKEFSERAERSANEDQPATP